MMNWFIALAKVRIDAGQSPPLPKWRGIEFLAILMQPFPYESKMIEIEKKKRGGR